MKSTLSSILATAFLLAFLPSVARAQIEGDNPDGVYFKQYTNPSNPTAGEPFELIMEAFVTGEKISISTETRVPLDAVLVLDVSGSMDYDLTVGSTSTLELLDKEYGATPGYYKFDYRPAVFTHTYPLRYYNGQWQYKPYYGDSYVNIIGSDYETQILNGNIEVYVSRLDALKTAVKRFIDVIQADARANDVEHKLSIVKFADDDYRSSNHLTEGNNTGYTQLVKNLTVVDETGADALKTAVNSLVADGATAADYGMTIAQEVLGQVSATGNTYYREGSTKAVVLFTDGDPTYGSSFSTDVANSTISKAKALKDAGVSVHTVGIFTNPNTNEQHYLEYTSSNYPSATNLTTPGTPATLESGKTFYNIVSNSTDLSSVFETIAGNISGGGASISLTETTTITAQFTKYFEIPSGTQEDDIKVYTAPLYYGPSDITRLDDFLFGTPALEPGVAIKSADYDVVISQVTNTAGETVDRVEIRGFDFSTHWCGTTGGSNIGDGGSEPGTDGNMDAGYKLIIVIPVEVSSDNPGGETDVTDPDSGIVPDGDDNPIAGDDVEVNMPNLTMIFTGLNPGETVVYAIYDKGESGDATPALVGYVAVTGTWDEDTQTTPPQSATYKSLTQNHCYSIQPASWSAAGGRTCPSREISRIATTLSGVYINIGDPTAPVAEATAVNTMLK